MGTPTSSAVIVGVRLTFAREETFFLLKQFGD